MTPDMILVTGITGFVGSSVAEELLANGYDVRGTTRDLGRSDIRLLREFARHHDREFEVVIATLTHDSGWDAALDGVAAVVHVASPAPKARPKDEQELIRPAVDGTLRLLRAAHRAGVRRVAMTSSVDAVRSGHDLSGGRVLGEETWSVVERCEPYAKSKTLAERAAWDAADELDLELVTLLPSLILGPVRGRDTNVSVDVIRQLMAHELPALPRLGFAPVDVRDVARAHRAAIEVPQAAGHRFILSTEPIWLAEIAEILDDEFRPRGYDIPRRRLPSPIVRLGARLNPTLRLALPLLDTPAATSSARARVDLGWTTRPVRDTIIETAQSLVDAGIVAPRRLASM